jgi:aspartyl protease family protein
VLDGTRVLTLERNRYGHYYAAGHINGREVEFRADTGATTAAVPAALEQRLGLQRQAGVPVETANGTVTGARRFPDTATVDKIDKHVAR